MVFVTQRFQRRVKSLGVSMNPIMVDGTGMCGACRLIVDGKVKFACVDGPEFDGHLVDFDQAMKRQQQYKTEEGRAKLAYEEGANITVAAETAEVTNNGSRCIKESTCQRAGSKGSCHKL